MEHPIEVLVVEDNPLMTALLEVTFRRDERMRTNFCTGEADEAMALAREHQPAVIVLDYLVGGEYTGPQLAPMLKTVAPDARIVLFTGSVDREHAGQAPHIDAALDKLQLHELLPTVRALADGRTGHAADTQGG